MLVSNKGFFFKKDLSISSAIKLLERFADSDEENSNEENFDGENKKNTRIVNSFLKHKKNWSKFFFFLNVLFLYIKITNNYCKKKQSQAFKKSSWKIRKSFWRRKRQKVPICCEQYRNFSDEEKMKCQ